MNHAVNNAAREAYMHARDVIKGRWLEGEHIIAKAGGHWAYCYAVNVINGRFIDAEELIAQDGQYKSMYIEHFFRNQDAITKDEVGEFVWNRLGLEGYFADVACFARPISVLDMVIEQ
jgi:hypothetical protein